MTLSGYLLSFIIATLLGLLFHVIVGGRGWRIILFVFCSWIGFFVGNSLGSVIDFKWLNIGPIHTLAASLGSIVFMLLGRWLGKTQKRE
jgi:uncharacterized membrane protein YeaQ/YmgE (transglycosylase-associated protein family)